MYEKTIHGVRKFGITPLGDINIYSGEDEFLTYGPDEWSEFEAKDDQ